MSMMKTKCDKSGSGGQCDGWRRWEVRTCWPDDCKCKPGCNRTGYIYHYCAQSFNVWDKIKYRRNECPEHEDCPYWVQKNWQGTVTIDASDTEVPFAGKKK